MFEVCFKSKSQYIYKAKPTEDENGRTTKNLDCYYIRLKNWKKIENLSSEKNQTLL